MATASKRGFFLFLFGCACGSEAQQTTGSDAGNLDPAIVEEVQAVLDRAYGRKEQPDLKPWVEELTSEDRAARAHGGAALHAMLVLVTEDRKARRTPPRESTKLWSGPQDFGLEVCWHVAEELATTRWPGNGQEVEAAATWLFANSRRVDERTWAMEALARIRTPNADVLIRDVVRKPHSTFQILRLALHAAADRGLRDLAPAAAALRDHYHPDVRGAAIAVAQALGCTDAAPAHDPDRMTPMLARWLELAADLVAEPIAPDAPWSKVTFPADRERGDEEWTVEGFVLEPGEGRPRLLLRAWGSVWPLDDDKAKVEAASLELGAPTGPTSGEWIGPRRKPV